MRLERVQKVPRGLTRWTRAHACRAQTRAARAMRITTAMALRRSRTPRRNMIRFYLIPSSVIHPSEEGWGRQNVETDLVNIWPSCSGLGDSEGGWAGCLPVPLPLPAFWPLPLALPSCSGPGDSPLPCGASEGGWLGAWPGDVLAPLPCGSSHGIGCAAGAHRCITGIHCCWYAAPKLGFGP